MKSSKVESPTANIPTKSHRKAEYQAAAAEEYMGEDEEDYEESGAFDSSLNNRDANFDQHDEYTY